MKNSGAESYYSTLTNYVKNVDGMKMTVCNPGTSVPQSYVGTCDTLEIAESAGLPSLSTLQSRTFYPNYDKSNFFMLAHDTNSITQTDVTDRMPYVGYEYITKDVEPNPYDTIPPYFLDEVAYLDTGSPTPTSTPTSTLPGSPTGLTATTVSSSQINLSWSFPSGTISGYKIERSTSGGTFSTIVSNTATTSMTYSDTGLASATQYTYRVSTINSVGTSSPSNTGSATTLTPIPPSILINPTTGPAGSTIAVSGNTFLSNSAVTISYDGAAVTTNPGAITTDSSGSFTATFTEPAPSTGSHTVIAKDAASGLASAQFPVTSTTSSTTSTTISLT